MTKRIALITGATSGFGRAIAEKFAANKYNVVITGRRKEAVEKAASEINVVGMVADQTNLRDIDKLVSSVSRQFG